MSCAPSRTFYGSPAGEKYRQNSRTLAEQSRQIGEEVEPQGRRRSQGAYDPGALREKGHKF